jgi:hypothetical protein
MRLSFLLLLSVFVTSCERRTLVKLEGGNPPSFVLAGSGRLDEVFIFAPEQERMASSDPFDDRYGIWNLQPEGEGENAKAFVEDLHSITYGVVPRGYKQVKPKAGAPPPLIPGKRYKYWFVTVNAPWGAGYFEMRDGKAVAVEGP